jgi:hypothetical protein
MFLARTLKSTNNQKRRISRFKVINFCVKRGDLNKFHYFIVALQGGFLNTKSVSYFFTYSKKICRLTKKTSKV